MVDDLMRIFLAIELPWQVQSRLGELIKKVSQVNMPVRWVSQSNLHLTLKFLGDISCSQLAVVSNALAEEALSVGRFSFRIENLGVFPNPRKPRIVWAGIMAPSEMLDLVQRIETRLLLEGFPREERPFSPHLTIGRVRQFASEEELRRIGTFIPSNRTGEISVVSVDAISIMRSQLRPEGPIYSRLKEIKLGR